MCVSRSVPCHTLIVAGVLALGVVSVPAWGDEPPRCGDGILQASSGEECDDGGTCIGGANAGTACTADTSCPGGVCTTFGGDGCAANCTTETDLTFELEPGGFDPGPTIQSGTSGVVECSDFLDVPLPLRGRLTLTVGHDRGDGQVPVVVRPLHLAAVPVSNLACGCVSLAEARTCGGRVLEANGSLAIDCTQSASACVGLSPCTAVHGAGNAGHGTIGCSAAPQFNCDGLSCCREPCGAGGPGEALLYLSQSVTSVPGACTGSDPSSYGADGAFCTADDPPVTLDGVAPTLLGTTGIASVGICDNSMCVETFQSRTDLVPPGSGPCSASGRPFTCHAGRIAEGTACLASVTTLAEGFGPATVAGQLCGHAVPQPTPTASPPPTVAPSTCLGDCDGDSMVTVNEIILLVNITLGAADPAACPSGGGCAIDFIIRAINNALKGCPETSVDEVAPLPRCIL